MVKVGEIFVYPPKSNLKLRVFREVMPPCTFET